LTTILSVDFSIISTDEEANTFNNYPEQP
jgi:hypothetical protein